MKCESRPLLVVDKTSTAVGLLVAFCGAVLWAFSTLNATTEERSLRNERNLETLNQRIETKLGVINNNILKILSEK